MKKLIITIIILLTASTSFAVYPTEYLAGRATHFYEDDDFISGLTTTGNIGKQGWVFDGTPTVTTSPLSSSTHPGALRFSTPASSSNVTLCLKVCNATTGIWDIAGDFDTTVIVTTLNWATSLTYIGYFMGDVVPTINYIGIQGRPASNNWMFLATGASITNSGVAIVDGTWYKLRIKKTGTSVEFYINDEYKATLTTTATGQAQPYFLVNTGNTTVKSLDIDYWSLTIPSLAR